MIKVGDWTDIGKITEIKDVEYTQDHLGVIKGEAKVGDTFKVWVSEHGSRSPFEPTLMSEEEYKLEQGLELSSMLSFYQENPRFVH